ncbi:hypothetical protein LUZ60_003981 [Juncus effusus]|nr:hypothetical protein LUZ60_003981 [Juncus effusus]
MYSSSEPDIISNLPENVREKILTYLPIKEAGRTSLLSSNWRQTWNSIPDLWIRDADYDEPDETVKMVDVILLLHEGRIHKFDLLTYGQCHDAFDRWIRYLSRNGIEQFYLNPMDRSLSYKIPSRFFSCSSLTTIYLYNCTIKLPQGFRGFKLLKTLMLNSVSISEACFEKLVSCCPLLESLRLFENEKNTILNINAPNLENFDVYGSFAFLHLCAPKLLTLCLSNAYNPYIKNNLNQVFGGIPNLEMLELRADFVENFLVEELVPGKFPLIFPNLKDLRVDWDFQKEEDSKFILSLLEHIPNLEELDIEMTVVPEAPTPSFWKLINKLDFSFQRLHIVNIFCCGCIEDALPFIKVLLGSAFELHQLIISHIHWCEKDPQVCLKQLVLFPRASTKAQIVFE